MNDQWEDNKLDVSIAFRWARDSERRGDWDEALQKWRILMESYKDRAIPVTSSALCYLELGQPDKAKEIIDVAISQFRNHPSTLLTASKVFASLGDLSTSESLLEDALSIHPDILEIHILSSRYASLNGSPEKSEQIILRCIDRFPDEPSPLIQYASIATDFERWEEARMRWDTVRKTFPSLKEGYVYGAEAANKLNLINESENLSKQAEIIGSPLTPLLARTIPEKSVRQA